MPLVSVNQDDKLNVYFPLLPHHYVYKLQDKLTFVKADKVKALSHYVLCSLSQKYIMRFISLSYDLFFYYVYLNQAMFAQLNYCLVLVCFCFFMLIYCI